MALRCSALRSSAAPPLQHHHERLPDLNRRVRLARRKTPLQRRHRSIFSRHRCHAAGYDAERRFLVR